jgi:Mg/Co/Ni transporter MgtE
MNAVDIAPRKPVAANPAMPAGEVSKLFLKHAISAVPVVDASEALLGIVSEGEFVRRGGVMPDERQSWWLEMLAEGEHLEPGFLAYVRSGERRMGDLMTRDV